MLCVLLAPTLHRQRLDQGRSIKLLEDMNARKIVFQHRIGSLFRGFGWVCSRCYSLQHPRRQLTRIRLTRWPERKTSSSASNRLSHGSLKARKLRVPEGYTPIFNGVNLTGWHVSPNNHHGVTPDFRVIHGAIVGTVSPFGDGGILLTDKSYRNFDLYMEVKPDYGCDSGIFFRSTESGHAYQITMDYLPGGSMGRLITETIDGRGGTDRAGNPRHERPTASSCATKDSPLEPGKPALLEQNARALWAVFRSE